MLRARLLVVMAAILFSTGGAAIKASSLTGWQVASLRAGIAAAAIFLLIPESRKIADRSILLAGMMYAVMGVSFAVANKLTTAANAIFLQDTAPVYLMLAGPWLLGERVHRRDWIFLGVMAIAVVLFFAGSPAASATAPAPVAGNTVAMVSAVAWAASIGALRWVEQNGRPAMAVVAMGNLTGCLAALPMALRGGFALTAVDLAAVLYLGLIQIALGYVILTRAIRRVSAVETSLLMMCEPVFSPLWAFLLHGERPGGWAMLGGALILAATAARVLASSTPNEETASARPGVPIQTAKNHRG
ncbi:MAG: EamA/RhaT family transporter [Acidobacteria bacterium]|nr:EamA/RhaT family transporter [Acidobacteriota bacterium]